MVVAQVTHSEIKNNTYYITLSVQNYQHLLQGFFVATMKEENHPQLYHGVQTTCQGFLIAKVSYVKQRKHKVKIKNQAALLNFCIIPMVWYTLTFTTLIMLGCRGRNGGRMLSAYKTTDGSACQWMYVPCVLCIAAHPNALVEVILVSWVIIRV